MTDAADHLITSLDDLLPLYGDVALGARTKEQDHLAPVYQEMIAASPFCALTTVGPEGTDCTPRGRWIGDWTDSTRDASRSWNTTSRTPRARSSRPPTKRPPS